MPVIAFIIMVALISDTFAERIVIVTHINNRRIITRSELEYYYSANPFDYPLSDNRSIKKEFYKKLIGKDSGKVNAMWGEQLFTGRGEVPDEKKSDQQIIKWILDNHRGVGYIKEDSFVQDPLKQILILE